MVSAVTEVTKNACLKSEIVLLFAIDKIFAYFRSSFQKTALKWVGR